MHEATEYTNRALGQALNTSSLRPTGRAGLLQGCGVFGGSIDTGQGFGEGRSGSISRSDRGGIILGRSTDQSKVLQGKPPRLIVGSNLHVLVQPFAGGIESDFGATLSASISMVVKTCAKRGYIETALRDKLSSLSAARVVNCLNYSFDAGFDEIEFQGMASTPISLMSELPGLQAFKAEDVSPLSFWGGPPNKQAWYEGSLLTMLLDQIMVAADKGNIKLLERFLST